MVRRRDRILFCWSSSWARAKLSSVTRAGTGISIHSSRARSWPAVVLGEVTPRRRCGRITRVRAEARVLFSLDVELDRTRIIESYVQGPLIPSAVNNSHPDALWSQWARIEEDIEKLR